MRPNVHCIVAWHPVLTDHQAFTYKELSLQSGLPITVFVARLEDETRRSQGWTDISATGIERRLIPKVSFLRDGLRNLIENRDQIHIFGSAFELPRMFLLLLLASILRIEFYIISEPYSPISLGYFEDKAVLRLKIKRWLRPLLYKGYVLSLKNRISGIFTISKLAHEQYVAAGMPTDKLFPFGYFIPSLVASNSKITRYTDSPLRVVFVGSLISRKGLPTLVGAARLAQKRGAKVKLDIYGPGDPATLDIDVNYIRYVSKIPFGQTQHWILDYDLLVLPSEYDGWGVVVNEALCAGVPVLCSDFVGARVLIETFGAGEIFSRGDEEALAHMLLTLSRDHEKLQTMKSACPSAAAAIQPSKAAAYMLQILSAKDCERNSIPTLW